MLIKRLQTKCKSVISKGGIQKAIVNHFVDASFANLSNLIESVLQLNLHILSHLFLLNVSHQQQSIRYD